MTLYSFGSNGCGQLGQGHTDDTDTPHPIRFANTATAPMLTGLIKLAFGGNHTLLLDGASGRLFGTGDNLYAQLGLLPSEVQSTTTEFVELRLPKGARPVDHVAAGWEFSVVITDDGGVYTTGKGPKGELGNGNSDIKQHREFLKVYQFDYSQPGGKVVKVVASMAHVVVLLESGELYGWGVSRKSQLGLVNVITGIATRPVAIDFNPAGSHNICKAVDVACGRTFTLVLGETKDQTQSVILLSNDKTMTKVIEEVSALDHNRSDPIVSVAAGWSAIYLLSKSGRLFSTGNNSHGQLGPVDKTALRFSSQSAGTEHFLGISQNGNSTVNTWGWGEHGNCGPQYGEDRPKGEVYEVFNGVARAVYGGYASSWILA